MSNETDELMGAGLQLQIAKEAHAQSLAAYLKEPSLQAKVLVDFMALEVDRLTRQLEAKRAAAKASWDAKYAQSQKDACCPECFEVPNE